MNFELVFKIVNMAVMPAWVLMAFFPEKDITRKLVYSHLYPLALALVYAVFIFWGMSDSAEGGMDSLESLRISFTSDKILIAAWVHYLVFDMFVGSWIAQNAIEKKVPKWLTAICLLFTLMLGPVGFLLYNLYIRVAKQNPAI